MKLTKGKIYDKLVYAAIIDTIYKYLSWIYFLIVLCELNNNFILLANEHLWLHVINFDYNYSSLI